MKRIGDDLLLDALKQREDYVQGAANAIDTKASQTIAAAAILAVQPAALLLASSIPAPAIVVQLIGYVIICVALYFSHCALDVRDYPSPGFPKDWFLDVKKQIPPNCSDEDVRESMVWALIHQAEGRVEEGRQVNEQRLEALRKARKAVTVALITNLSAFVITAVTRVFSSH